QRRRRSPPRLCPWLPLPGGGAVPRSDHFPNHSFPRAVAAEVPQRMDLVPVEAINGGVQAQLAGAPVTPGGERVGDARRPILLFKSIQDQGLIGGALLEAFDELPAQRQLAAVAVVVRPGGRRSGVSPPASWAQAHGIPFFSVCSLTDPASCATGPGAAGPRRGRRRSLRTGQVLRPRGWPSTGKAPLLQAQ